MERIIISVRNGIVNIEENIHNLNIKIIDPDNEEEKKEITEEEMRDYDAVVEVRSGLASLKHLVTEVQIIIKDYDKGVTVFFK
jgi:hypothetical protein